jgi:methylated-DNA-protein-cysteine methyltransferase-like protein
MSKSPAFARIKRDVVSITCSIPRGRVTTYGAIGAALDVMARHVAYILATLDDSERSQIPWHRVVGDRGLIRATTTRPVAQQIAVLQAEGVQVSARNVVADFDNLFFEV